MHITKRSRLLSTAIVALLALATPGCSVISGLDEWGVPVASARTADQVQIQPILRVGHQARNRGDLATAAALYRRAHEMAPEQVEPLLHLGHTLKQAGFAAPAAQAFQAALAIEPDNTEAMRALGLALLQANQIQPALEQFYAALAIKEDVRLYNAIGVAYDMAGDHYGAQTHYYVGLDVEPTNLSLRTNLGLSLALTGDFTDAIAMLNTVASDPAATPEHRQTLALAYSLAGDEQSAARTSGIDNDPATVHRNLQHYEALRGQPLNRS